MSKALIILIISLFIQTYCEYRIIDGSHLRSLSYEINQDYDASTPVSINTFDQEMKYQFLKPFHLTHKVSIIHLNLKDD